MLQGKFGHFNEEMWKKSYRKLANEIRKELTISYKHTHCVNA